MSQDVIAFESYMQAGFELQHHADHEEALAARLAAYDLATNPIDSGRAARNIAISLYKLGNTYLADERQGMEGVSNELLAQAYAEQAYTLHQKFVPYFHGLEANHRIDIGSLMSPKVELSEETLSGAREFTLSAICMAIAEAKQGHDNLAIDYKDQATYVSWGLFQRFGQFNEYDVILVSEAAAVEGALAKTAGIFRARLAINLARVSETGALIGK